ncbi:MAG: DUF4129 domain-containing protein [Propionibacteriaceae bacterium]
MAATWWVFGVFLDHSKLVGGIAAPNILGPFLILVSTWLLLNLPRIHRQSTTTIRAIGLLSSLTLSFLWLSWEPNYRLTQLLLYGGDAATTTHSFWTVPFLLGVSYGLIGTWLAGDETQLLSRELRRNVLIFLAIAWGGSFFSFWSSSEAKSASTIGALVTVFVTIALLILAQLTETREAAKLRNIDVPLWSHARGPALTWLVLATLLAALCFSAFGRQGIGFYLLACVRLFQLLLAALFLFALLISGRISWDTLVERITRSQEKGAEAARQQVKTAQDPLQNATTTGPLSPTVLLITSIVLFLLIILAIFIALRKMSQRKVTASESTNLGKNVFSLSLVRQQLASFFNRASSPRRSTRHVTLSDDPESVRESMLFLHALAHRHNLTRHLRESARDFTDRLALSWNAEAEHLSMLCTLYESARYDETAQQQEDAITAWRAIYHAHSSINEAKRR